MIEKVLQYVDTLDTPENIVVYKIYADEIDASALYLADGITEVKSDCVKMLRGFLGDRIAASAFYRTSLMIALLTDILENG